MDIYSKHSEIVARTVIQELEKRNIQGYFYNNAEEARQKVISLIPVGASVMTGGSHTLIEIGILTDIEQGSYNYYRPRIQATNDEKVRNRLRRESSTADVFLGGINALCMTGEIVNMDGGGSRIGAYAFGADKVIMVAGINKIVPDLQTALDRVRHRAAVINAMDQKKNTPCTKTGICDNYDCYPPERQCGKLLVIEKESAGRLTVVLVGGNYGF